MSSIASRLGRIAIIGGGKMGEAILSGLVNGAMFDPDSIFVAEPSADVRERLCETYGVTCLATGTEIAEPETVILAVKPQVLRAVSEELVQGPHFHPQRLISIAAGVTTASLRALYPKPEIIRVMPNVALLVGAGMSVVCTEAATSRSEGELARELFALMGEAIIIDEDQINAATAISGSGPAYFALFVEELARAGAQAGLDHADAMLLAEQTLHGSARYLELTDATAEQLRIAVTSPNGTTQAALESMGKSGFDAVIKAAVAACVQRAEELA